MNTLRQAQGEWLRLNQKLKYYIACCDTRFKLEVVQLIGNQRVSIREVCKNMSLGEQRSNAELSGSKSIGL